MKKVCMVNKNRELTSAGIGQIVVKELKFDPANAAECTYFVVANG